MGEFHPALDDVASGTDAVAQFGGQRIPAIGQLQTEFAVLGRVAGEGPLGPAGAVVEPYLEAYRSEPRTGLRGQFVRGRVRLEAARSRRVGHEQLTKGFGVELFPQYRCRGLPSAPIRTA